MFIQGICIDLRNMPRHHPVKVDIHSLTGESGVGCKDGPGPGPAGTGGHHAGDSIVRVHFRINEGRYAGQCRYQLYPCTSCRGFARLASCRRGCGDVPVPGGEACELIPGAPVAPSYCSRHYRGRASGCCVLMRASSFCNASRCFPQAV